MEKFVSSFGSKRLNWEIGSRFGSFRVLSWYHNLNLLAPSYYSNNCLKKESNKIS